MPGACPSSYSRVVKGSCSYYLGFLTTVASCRPGCRHVSPLPHGGPPDDGARGRSVLSLKGASTAGGVKGLGSSGGTPPTLLGKGKGVKVPLSCTPLGVQSLVGDGLLRSDHHRVWAYLLAIGPIYMLHTSGTRVLEVGPDQSTLPLGTFALQSNGS